MTRYNSKKYILKLYLVDLIFVNLINKKRKIQIFKFFFTNSNNKKNIIKSIRCLIYVHVCSRGKKPINTVR